MDKMCLSRDKNGQNVPVQKQKCRTSAFLGTKIVKLFSRAEIQKRFKCAFPKLEMTKMKPSLVLPTLYMRQRENGPFLATCGGDPTWQPRQTKNKRK